MEIKIQLVVEAYKEELFKLTNENVLLKAQINHLQNELKELKKEGFDEYLSKPININDLNKIIYKYFGK